MTPVALVVAFGSGVVSFLAPCTVPLLPAYVGVLSGSAAGVSVEQQTARLIRGSLLYVVGFTAVFVALGVAAGSLGQAVRQSGGPVQRIGGGLVLLLAAALLADARYGLLSRLAPTGDRGRSRLARSSSAFAPLLLGVVFGTAFTPCVGPFLGATLSLAASEGGAAQGGVLLAVYALGLGVPFVVASLAVSGSPALARRLNRLARPVAVVGAVLLLLLGGALVSGSYGHVAGVLARANPFSS
ncbi:MAG TPA: cytochrome c biogenesis protein CcdA [Mycobacteriales bacterium]|jgi:cytochrome c-type biogenesis protein|nr:cytochrome c biogenesis protein CcdA [Mycobacteriales bacterium]